jgi:peptide deformylase
MIDTMRAARGVGLAAPQVGRPLRVIVIEVPPPSPEANPPLAEGEDPPRAEGPAGQPAGEVIVLINPEIVRRSGQRRVTEGCLSVPGYCAELTRSLRVTVKGLDLGGREVRIKGEDLLAQALEHEIDHINGVLYIDHLESTDQLVKIEPEGEEESGLSEPPPAADPPRRAAVWPPPAETRAGP